jgi:CRP-like cAMP-binding protein
MGPETTGNILLDSFSEEAREALGITVETFPLGDRVLHTDEVPTRAFFPHRGVIASIVRADAAGDTVEAGVVANEGVFPLNVLLVTPSKSANDVVVQNEGQFSLVDLTVLRERFEADAQVRNLLLAFTANYLEQLTQTLLCNRLHSIEQRLAKWILVVRDRVYKNDLHLTHEFLSHMLGVHRPGVSVAVNALAMDGLIHHSRKSIQVRDEEGLIARACDCYEVIRTSLETYRASLKPQT